MIDLKIFKKIIIVTSIFLVHNTYALIGTPTRPQGKSYTYSGNEFSGNFSGVNNGGNKKRYSGRNQGGCLIYGPYIKEPFRKFKTGKLTAWPKANLRMAPSTYETCRKRDWKGKCYSWATHDHDHSFTIDVVTNVGTRVLRSVPINNKKNISDEQLDLQARFDDGLWNLEYRLCGIRGIDYIHEFTLDFIEFNVTQ